MTSEKFDLSVILRFIDKSAAGVQGFQKNMSKIGKQMKTIGTEMRNKVTLPIVLFGANAIRVGADFQRTMNVVGAVTGTTGKEFEKLKLLARDLGETTQFSAVQSGQAMRFMGMAGFGANKIMAATPKVLQLAAAAALDMGVAADITTNIMAGWGFEAKDMTRVNDILVNTFTNTNVSLPQMGLSMKRVGPIANKLGLRFTEVSAALGLMGNAGIQGSEAGIALRRALINLQKPTKAQQKAMNFLELEFKHTDGTMKDLSEIMGEFENATKKGATETQIITGMMEIFGVRAVAPMIALLGEGSEALREMEEKTKKVGTAQRIAKRQMSGLPGALKLITSAWKGVLIALTEGQFGKWVNDTLRGFAKVLTKVSEFVNTHPDIVKWGLVVATTFAIGGPALIALGLATTAFAALSVPIVATAAAIPIIIAAIAKLEKLRPKLSFAPGLGGEFTEEQRTTINKEITRKQALGISDDTLTPSEDSRSLTNRVLDFIHSQRRESLFPNLESAFKASESSEVVLKVQSANGTTATVTGIKGNVKVESEAFVGSTLQGITK
jgi:TP901 family phage tail tape measure protein